MAHNHSIMKTLLTTLAFFILFQTNAQSDLIKALGGLKVEEDNSPFVPNEFIGSFVVEQHFYKNVEERKYSPKTLHYWSAEDRTLVYSVDKEGNDDGLHILTDLRAKYTYSLQTDKDGRKTALKMHKKTMSMKEDKGSAPPEVKVTTETKTILGHTCVKVIYTDKKGTSICWMAQDVPAPLGDLTRGLGSGNATKQETVRSFKGFALESEFIDADGKNRSTNLVKELNVGSVDQAVFSLEGYEIQELPGSGQ